MMDLATIRSESRKAARKAAHDHKLPLIVEQEDIVDIGTAMARLRFPNIGDWRPKGYTLLRTLFVDHSGFGAPGELAMTQDEFLKTLQPGLAYAIVEVGQFQLYVGEFRPPRARKESV